MQKFIKKIIEKNSSYLSFVRFIPFQFRLGPSYSLHKKIIRDFEQLGIEDREAYYFSKLKKLLVYSYNEIPFYRQFYDMNDFHPSQFKTLSDFKNVPIVKKKDLKNFELKTRSKKHTGDFFINTGGTSGQPLAFYLDRQAFAREWAYMHKVWSKLDYKITDFKITFRGKSTSNGFPIQYNAIHNEYVVDAYSKMSDIVDFLNFSKFTSKLRYIHGYPSFIYQFCRYLKDSNINVSALFPELKGIFFGSEFPLVFQRTLIEKVLNVKSVSWYGHSEMSVLAYEKEQSYRYHVLPSYGFAETIEIGNSGNHLVTTSLYNFSSPFIRYDTEDLIQNERYTGPFLESFEISSGRIGDFVVDSKGQEISLTALIFGRHHKAFNYADFIQVQQLEPGHLVFYITSEVVLTEDSFDLKNIDIKFDLVLASSPYKTSSGKVPLKIPIEVVL